MRTVRVEGASVLGYLAEPVTVEARFVSELRDSTEVLLTGLPDTVLRESRRRLQCALAEAGLGLPRGRLFVNLVPAARRKSGECLDLPIALAAAAAAGHLDPGALEGVLFLGELGLDGGLHAVPGGLGAGVLARERGLARLIAPPDTAREAALVTELTAFGARHLTQVVAHLTRGEGFLPAVSSGPRADSVEDAATRRERAVRSLERIRGQTAGKHALVVAAAGGHGLLWVGPPGAGKTLLSRALPELLPPLDVEERLAVTRVRCAAGHSAEEPGTLAAARPFRAPHHTASYAGMVGGGSAVRPGEISLAHGGVLFLDELPEFRREVLEALRQPLEEGRVLIARAGQRIELPARFRLVAAMNPCPCGFRGHPARPCSCPPAFVRRYRSRLSGPFLDRIPLRVELSPPRLEELTGDGPLPAAPAKETAAHGLDRLAAARSRALDRQGRTPNAELRADELDRWARLDGPSRRLLERIVERRHLSGRAIQGLRQVARTLADLDDADRPAEEHFARALALRAPLSLS